MARIIRPSYPLQFSIGLLLLIFLLSTFISFEIFDTNWRVIIEGGGPITGMVLAGLTNVVVALILWEEFLFPVRIKLEKDEIVFRNHYTKLKTQVLVYAVVPLSILFIYLNYEINLVPFLIWATICLVAPVGGKLLSGIRNYNDFLKLTGDAIEFRNNEHEGVLPVRDIREIIMIRDEANVLHKVKVLKSDNTEEIIDLDEMELDAYYETIDQFITGHFPTLVNEPVPRAI